MIELELAEVPRSNDEAAFLLSLQACPGCGQHAELTATHTGPLAADVGEPKRDLLMATCASCGVQRRVAFPSDETLRWMSELDEVGGRTPSRLISPPRFLSEIRRLEGLTPAAPTQTTYPDYVAGRLATYRMVLCAKELIKFLNEGDREISPTHFRTASDRSTRNANPSDFSRETLESLRSGIQSQLERYLEAESRFQAMKAAHPPPKPPAFSKASLDAHRQWARSPEKGPAVGQQLVAEDVAQPGARLGAQDLSGSIVTRADLSGADLSSADVHAVRWTDVDLSRARLGSALLHSSKFVRCRFGEAGMGLTSVGDSIVEDCDFAGADLNRSTWFRADVARCDFDGARIGDARFDHAVVVDSSFRGASFATTFDKVFGTAARAWFIRCDFRGVDWTGRWFYNTVFVDCLFAGSHGTPHGFQDIHLIGCALDPGGPPLDVADLAALLALPAEHIIDKPDKKPRANERPYVRITVENGKTWRNHIEEHSPLLLAERARDPSAPFPVPFNIP